MTKKYPFQNKSLEDMPGEIWKELPGWRHYALSNIGRVKSKDRMVVGFAGKKYLKKGQIISQSLFTDKFNGKMKNYLMFQVYREGVIHRFVTARLVYYLFVKKFNIKDRSRIPLYKDGDGRNVSASNLSLSTFSNQKKDYWAKNQSKPRVKKILQFYPDGRLRQVFKSMQQAVKACKISMRRLNESLDKPHYLYKGYFWRSADLKWMEFFLETSDEVSKPVIQYSLEGKKVAEFISIKHAAIKMGLEPHIINRVMGKSTRSCKGYRWGWADQDKPEII